MNDRSGIIFSIQRFSIHDGPGIRTTVFFKGCPLRCFWCHNPEGLRRKIEIQFFASRCTGCGDCVRACPQGAQALLAAENGGTPVRFYHRERCVMCGACVDACFSESLLLAGQEMAAQQVVAEVLRDRAFYTAEGGVTLSGGEPLLQPAFARAVLSGCRAEGVHTALETTAYYPWETLASVLPYVDLLMIDIKHLDSRKHRAVTGVPNERILANLRRLARTGKPVIFRTPVIPGVNDTPEEIAAIARFVRELGETPPENGPADAGRFLLELLPFHKLAGDKYRSLGLDERAAHLEPPSREQMAVLERAAGDQGIQCRTR